MIWPPKKPAALYAGAKLLQIVPDEVDGKLFIRAVFGETQACDIVYEGMYYSQLDQRAEGLTVELAAEISLEELKQPEYRQAANRLYDDCGADDAFLRDMCLRGSLLFIHHADGGPYIVLAKRLIIGAQEEGKN